MVTEQELKELLRRHGWYLDMIRRYRTRYAYAKRRTPEGKMQARYIASERNLNNLTEGDVVGKLSQESDSDTSSV